jgi:hypothetical protein
MDQPLWFTNQKQGGPVRSYYYTLLAGAHISSQREWTPRLGSWWKPLNPFRLLTNILNIYKYQLHRLNQGPWVQSIIFGAQYGHLNGFGVFTMAHICCANILGQKHFPEPNQQVLTYLHSILLCRVTYWAPLGMSPTTQRSLPSFLVWDSMFFLRVLCVG